MHNNILTWSYSEGISLPLKYFSAKVIVHSHNSYMNPGMYSRRILNFVNRRFNYRNDIIRLACSEGARKWLLKIDQPKLYQMELKLGVINSMQLLEINIEKI